MFVASEGEDPILGREEGRPPELVQRIRERANWLFEAASKVPQNGEQLKVLCAYLGCVARICSKAASCRSHLIADDLSEKPSPIIGGSPTTGEPFCFLNEPRAPSTFEPKSPAVPKLLEEAMSEVVLTPCAPTLRGDIEAPDSGYTSFMSGSTCSNSDIPQKSLPPRREGPPPSPVKTDDRVFVNVQPPNFFADRIRPEIEVLPPGTFKDGFLEFVDLLNRVATDDSDFPSPMLLSDKSDDWVVVVEATRAESARLPSA